MADYSGFATLGDIITGGSRREAEANYPKYLGEAANGYKALDLAAEERAKRLARDAVGERYRAWAAAQGLSPEAADLGAAYATGGNMNFNTQMGGTGRLADLEMDRQITQALADGDLARAQRISAVKTDKVLPTLGAGGKAVFTPVTGDVEMTSLGDAALAAQQALVGQREAAAAKSARAPAPRSGGTHGSSTKRSASEAKAIVAALRKEMGRDLTPDEVAQVYSGGDFNFKESPAAVGGAGSLGDVAPTADVPAVREGYTSFDDIPPEAKGKLKEGIKTTFGNGQVWTLVHGQPTRVK